MIITIDGPTASGKSSVAHEIARRNNFYYVCSGMLYRAISYSLCAYNAYTDAELEQPDSDLVHDLCNTRLTYQYNPEQGMRICYDDSDITPFLKTKAIDAAASLVSRDPHVRSCAVAYQKRLAQHYTIIADGRDCGTVVFPDAAYKFFLTADVMIRACRWQAYQQCKGYTYSLDMCKQLLDERDNRDSTRKHSPLKPALDAIHIDTSDMSFDAVVSHIEAILSQ